MKKGKVVLESGRAYSEKHKKAELDKLCPECQGPGRYCGSIKKGFLKRDEYNIYSCECRTKWMVFDKREKIKFKMPRIAEPVAAGLIVSSICLGFFGVAFLVEGFLDTGGILTTLAIVLFTLTIKAMADDFY